MSRQNVLALVSLAVFPFAAVGIATYMLATASTSIAITAGAILVLSAGFMAVAIVLTLRMTRQEEWIWQQEDNWRELTDKLDASTLRLDEVERQARQPGLKLDEIMADVRALRDGFRSMIQSREQAAHREPDPAPAPVPAFQSTAPARPRSSNEHLELLLEPVIELSTGNTAHYRAMIELTDDQGHVVRHAELMQKADQGGMRPALDAHLVKLVAPVLRRLRAKNPSLRAIVPIGVSTLGSREETSRVLANLERDADVAGGIVFEFNHRDLGSLDNIGIENLAKLGRLGATLALSQVQVGGLDLAALRQLGVRFLSFPPNAADAGFGPTAAWREFVQYSRAMQYQIIVSDITTPQQANAANLIGRYGFGSFFAPPRKVRTDAGTSANHRQSSAA
jgi:EAL domain-containing protein (putative c-di-GMP-specific phosphodiesterase class I)